MDKIATEIKLPGMPKGEADLIQAIEKRGLSIFTFDQAMELTPIGRDSVKKLIYNLTKKRRIQRIERGKYLFIPVSVRGQGEYSEKGTIIAANLINPYYLSYWTALSFYGWTEQPSRKIFIATTKQKAPLKVQGMTFRFIRLRPNRFFGYCQHRDGPYEVMIADKEKAIVDCLDQPRYCGEIVEVAKSIWNGRNEIDFHKVLTYAERMGNGAIIKRLGYIMETLGILTPESRKKLLPRVRRGIVSLDPDGAKSRGEISPEWQLKVNVNPQNLTEWIRH